MSARVINPGMLAEFTKIRSPAIRSHMPSAGSLAKIKRDLFGPVDKEDSKRFVNAELAKHQLTATKRWGFDFSRGFPMAESRQYIWERVPPTTSIPEVYTLSRAAHARVSTLSAAIATCVPSMDDLLDQRSERSNRPTQVQRDVSRPSTSTCESSRICPATEIKTNSPTRASIREKRQPKITDYLKERKRLTPTKKLSPSKKMRSTLASLLRQSNSH